MWKATQIEIQADRAKRVKLEQVWDWVSLAVASIAGTLVLVKMIGFIGVMLRFAGGG